MQPLTAVTERVTVEVFEKVKSKCKVIISSIKLKSFLNKYYFMRNFGYGMTFINIST